jgi:hypothetical protein
MNTGIEQGLSRKDFGLGASSMGTVGSALILGMPTESICSRRFGLAFWSACALSPYSRTGLLDNYLVFMNIVGLARGGPTRSFVFNNIVGWSFIFDGFDWGEKERWDV